jgi:hypothetical protein
LPSDYADAFRVELRRAFSAPYEVPLVVVMNGLMMSAAWFLLPVPLHDMLFSLHGSLAFPIVLVSWMFADVPATNVLGSDPQRILAALDDPEALRRLLYAKNAVLWLMAAPVCGLVAIEIGGLSHHWASMVIITIGILVIPIGSLGIASWVGICYPYHPIPLSTRWAHRRAFRPMIGRWGVLVTLPYVVVPALTTAMAAPAFYTWKLLSDDWQRHLPIAELAIGVAFTVVLSAAVFVYGHRAGLRLIARHHDRLRVYLADPDLG